ncbi:MAG: ABC transporter ATP-binding protein [Nitrospirota bacterium]|nr:MAG: ABC transporter ATP-binding protein [Nitrospirota bacterium]
MKDIFRDRSDIEWKNDVVILWRLVNAHLGRLVLAIMFSLMLSSVNGGIAWIAGDALDNIAKQDKLFLKFLPLVAFGLFVFRGLFSFANNFLMNSIGAKIVRSLRSAFHEHIMNLPLSFHSNESSGSAISRMMNDVALLERQIPDTAKNFFVQSTTAIALALVALYRKWDLALLAFAVIPFVIYASDKFAKRMKVTAARTRTLIANVTKIANETLGGIRIIKSFTMEKDMTKRNDEAVSAHYRNFMREIRINEFTSTVMEIIAGAGVAVIFWYGFYLLFLEKMTHGQLVSFFIAVTLMFEPLKRLSRTNNSLQMIRSALHRIKEVFQLEHEKSGDQKLTSVKGDIEYKDVSFRYPASPKPVLSDISIGIKAGETLAIVGYSGAGKSTFVDLLLGFWDGYEGTISIDGTDIRHYDLRSLRSHIGMVSQDIFLFDDSIRNNILFGKEGSSDEEIIAAAKAAYAHEFIMDSPDGYDTFIGERGIKLSGGQKQRISLARAIIKNPEILILDEATSSLDTDSETKIQKALEGFLPGRTTIIIAHRLSTIKKADRIVVLDKGKIIQQGQHDVLFNSGGLYKDLYDMQFGLSK